MPEAQTPAKPIGARSLFINLVFTIFVSLVVFTVATYAFLMPLIASERAVITGLSARVAAMQQRLDDQDAALGRLAKVAVRAPAPAAPAPAAKGGK